MVTEGYMREITALKHASGKSLVRARDSIENLVELQDNTAVLLATSDPMNFLSDIENL